MEKEILMKKFVIFFVAVLVAMPIASFGECTLSHEECHYVYTCTEYYPNKTDCKKTVKTQECHTVCDEFDVDRGGIDDANRGVKGSSQGEGSSSGESK